MHDGPSAEDLALFLAIDRAGSLTAAAADLGLNQSTVSRRLSELEARLGSVLFVRTRDGALPTDLGLSWRGPARALEQAVAEAGRALADRTTGVSGTVRLATPVVLADQVLIPALPTLLDRHPRLQVQVLATPDVADLARLEADIAVRFVRPTTGDLVARRLLTLSLAAWARPDLSLGDEPRSWPWVGWADARMSLGETAWFEAQGIEPRVQVLAPTSLLAALRAGLGVGLLPRALAGRMPDLREVPMAGPPGEIVMWAVSHRAVRALPRVDAAWSWLGETLADP